MLHLNTGWDACRLHKQVIANVPRHQSQRRSEQPVQRPTEGPGHENRGLGELHLIKSEKVTGVPTANRNVASVVKVWCLKSSLQVSIKILNVGAWARTSERVPVTLPRELEDFIPEVRPAIILLLQ